MSKRILLCDDEIHIVRAAEFKFRRAGFDVEIAGDGEDAWAAILRQPPDFLITDYQMPVLDGLGLCRRIRQSPGFEQLPIVLLTAKGFELTEDDVAREFGVRALMTKPFSPRELLALVERELGVATAAG